jgi:hypothetical protein
MATPYFESALPDSQWSSQVMSGRPAPLRVLVREKQPETEQRQWSWPAAAAVDFKNISRCMRWAFALEGSAALVACAVWFACRLI